MEVTTNPRTDVQVNPVRWWEMILGNEVLEVLFSLLDSREEADPSWGSRGCSVSTAVLLDVRSRLRAELEDLVVPPECWGLLQDFEDALEWALPSGLASRWSGLPADLSGKVSELNHYRANGDEFDEEIVQVSVGRPSQDWLPGFDPGLDRDDVKQYVLEVAHLTGGDVCFRKGRHGVDLPDLPFSIFPTFREMKNGGFMTWIEGRYVACPDRMVREHGPRRRICSGKSRVGKPWTLWAAGPITFFTGDGGKVTGFSPNLRASRKEGFDFELLQAHLETCVQRVFGGILGANPKVELLFGGKDLWGWGNSGWFRFGQQEEPTFPKSKPIKVRIKVRTHRR